MGQELLQLRDDHYSLGIPEQTWKQALKDVQQDAIGQLLHAPLSGNARYRYHVASIPQNVSCHVHFHGEEGYAVVGGKGILHWGKVGKATDGSFFVSWEEPACVKAGDSFVIPEGYAHQLEKNGDEDLTILFSCPDSHIDDNLDRTVLPDSPSLRKGRCTRPPLAAPRLDDPTLNHSLHI